MAMLYDFLTSNKFKSQMEGIVERYTQMNTDLQKKMPRNNYVSELNKSLTIPLTCMDLLKK